MGKKGGLSSYQRANGFLLKPQLTPKVFGTFAKRYADREGGYTRIHKYGNRPGDNAPHAILELVDNPRDIKFEMTARAIGWEVLSKKLGTTGPRELVNSGVGGVESIVSQEQQLGPKDRGHLRPTTRWNLQKVLRFRNPESVSILGKKAEDHIVRVLFVAISHFVSSIWVGYTFGTTRSTQATVGCQFGEVRIRRRNSPCWPQSPSNSCRPKAPGW